VIGAEREREVRGAGAERRAGVTKVGLSGERKIGRSRSAHMLWSRGEGRSPPEAEAFLADRTNGRAIGTVLRLSVCRLSLCLSVCDVMYCG